MKTLTIVYLTSLLLRQLIAQHLSTSCDDAYECKNQTISIGTSTAYCLGYNGCSGATIECGDLWAVSYLGAEGANILASRDVNALGAGSVHYATVNTPELYADGYQAASQANITSSLVNAYGILSTWNATISARNHTLMVKFYGYQSGAEADIICYDGDTCNVDCGIPKYSSGCTSNTKFYCYSGATCSYHCNDYPDDCLTLVGGPNSGLSDGQIFELYNKNTKIKNSVFKNEHPEDEPIDYEPINYEPSSNNLWTTINLSSSSWIIAIIFGESLLIIILLICMFGRKRNEYSKTRPADLDFESDDDAEAPIKMNGN